MNWLAGEWLWTIGVVGVIGVLGFVATALHRRAVAAAFGEVLALDVLPRGTRRRRTIRDVFLVSALVLFCVALAEPAFDKQIVQVKTEGVDLVLAIDLSRSMDADDVDPSRMERARREVEDLLEVMVGDRVAIVFFAGEAIGRLPLTEDYKAVKWVLGEADSRVFRAQGSAVGKAIDVARKMLARDEGKAGKAMVIFSDGETHDPDEALRAAREAADEGLVIYTVAIGDATSTIPDRQGGYVMFEGAKVKTTPDFATLEEVARITGGATVKSIPSASDMEGLYRKEIRSTVRAAQRETQKTESWRSAYQAPLGVGLLLWLAGAWLGDGRRAFGAATAVVLAVSLASAPAHAAPSVTTEVEADSLYRAGDFRRAEKAFEDLSLQSPSNTDLLRRLGAARYRMGDYVGAASAYERASQLAGGDPDALYNAGNARYRAGQLEEAMGRYDQAVQVDPSHEASLANKAVVEGELTARRQQQPPPPPEPQDGGGEDDKEGGGGEDDPTDPTEGDQKGDEEQEGNGDEPSDQNQDSNDGSSDAGEQQQEQEQEGDGSEGGKSESDSEPTDEEGVNPEDIDGSEGEEDGEPQEGEDDSGQGDSEGASGMGEASGDITPAQASKMLDAVEEGRQRVQYVGREGAKPW